MWICFSCQWDLQTETEKLSLKKTTQFGLHFVSLIFIWGCQVYFRWGLMPLDFFFCLSKQQLSTAPVTLSILPKDDNTHSPPRFHRIGNSPYQRKKKILLNKRKVRRVLFSFVPMWRRKKASKNIQVWEEDSQENDRLQPSKSISSSDVTVRDVKQMFSSARPAFLDVRSRTHVRP